MSGVALALVVVAAACLPPDGEPCCNEDVDCDDGLRCVDDRCVLRCTDDFQCPEGARCDVDVCRFERADDCSDDGVTS